MNRLLSLRHWKTRAVFWSGALAVGLTAVGFAAACNWAIRVQGEFAARFLWAQLLITPLGLLLVVWLTRRFAPGSQGSGIPQAIAAL